MAARLGPEVEWNLVVRIYVSDEDWNAGRGHRMRFDALREALADRGFNAIRTNDLEGQRVDLCAGGPLTLLRRSVRAQRPTTLRDDTPGVAVVCYPSTLALEMICMGYRVALLAPRNYGESDVAREIATLSDEERFARIDGLGAERMAALLCQTL